MRVDEAGDQHRAGHVDDTAPLVIRADAHDGVAADRHVAGDHLARHQVEHLPAAQHHVSRFVAASLRDAGFKIGHGRLRACGFAARVAQPATKGERAGRQRPAKLRQPASQRVRVVTTQAAANIHASVEKAPGNRQKAVNRAMVSAPSVSPPR